MAPQALTLFNGDFVNRQAGRLARRLHREAGDDDARQITLAYRLALAREPNRNEVSRLTQFLHIERKALQSGSRKLTPEEVDYKALQQMCRIILNLNEFVYPD